MNRLFVDTSAWFAYANRADPDHQRIVEALSGFEGRLLTSNFVFDETVTLCAYRLGRETAVKVGEAILDPAVTELLRITAGDEGDSWALFRRRRDPPYSFTDCTSFVLMRRLGVREAASLDEDFRREGFGIVPGP